MSSHKDYYEVLQINPHADRRAISEAYERLARAIQPSEDVPPSDPQRMRDLDEAFDILDDPARRAEYDWLRANPAASAADAPSEDVDGAPLAAPAAARPRLPSNWPALALLGAGAIAFVAALAVFALLIFGGEGERTVTLESGLVYTELAGGSGDPPRPGDALTVHYTGSLENGTVFDTSRDGNPFVFFLGERQVIEGWEQGFASMKEGARRRLTIPPGLAYGAEGAPPDIPPDATIIFDVELLQIESTGKEVKTGSGLTYVNLEIGPNPPRSFQAVTPKKGDRVTVHYTGRLADGTLFADSQAEGSPRLFVLGSGSEIDGFDEGVSTMKAGSLRRLIIPPALGYGNRAQDFDFQGQPVTIPPGSTLIFEVKLVSVEPG